MESRDIKGRFVKGNAIGHRFKKGETGSKKGMKWKRTQAAGEFAREILGTDPETGEKLSTQEVIERISKFAEKHPQCMIELPRHDLGKPIERVQIEPTAYLITGKEEQELSESNRVGPYTLGEAEDESEDQGNLPEGE